MSVISILQDDAFAPLRGWLLHSIFMPLCAAGTHAAVRGWLLYSIFMPLCAVSIHAAVRGWRSFLCRYARLAGGAVPSAPPPHGRGLAPNPE